MSCYNIDLSRCGGSCGGWGCYCEGTSFLNTYSFSTVKCSCQPRTAYTVGFAFFGVAFVTLLLIVAKWKTWVYSADAEMHHPNKCCKLWTSTVCITMFISGLVCMGVGANPLDKFDQDASFPCATTEAGLTTAFFFMVAGFWCIIAPCACLQFSMCSSQQRQIVIPAPPVQQRQQAPTVIVMGGAPYYYPQQGYPAPPGSMGYPTDAAAQYTAPAYPLQQNTYPSQAPPYSVDSK